LQTVTKRTAKCISPIQFVSYLSIIHGIPFFIPYHQCILHSKSKLHWQTLLLGMVVLDQNGEFSHFSASLILNRGEMNFCMAYDDHHKNIFLD
jgi:hypothetical protein